MIIQQMTIFEEMYLLIYRQWAEILTIDESWHYRLALG